MMKAVLPVLIGVLVAFLPFLAMELAKFLQDKRQQSKLATASKQVQMQAMNEPSKRSVFNSLLSSAMNDQRLAGKERPIMIPDKKKIKELEDQGVEVTDENRPMKPLQDAGGNTVMENTAEKWDPRFDQFKDGAESPILARIYIDPGKGAPTYRRQYFILMGLSIIIGIIAAFTHLWFLFLVPIGISAYCLSLMLKRGQECQDSNKLLWSKLDTIYATHIRPFATGETVQDLVDINEWSAPRDDLYEANAKTWAAEQGLSEELMKILPKVDKKTGRLIKPRRACFRDVPSKMTIHFDAHFMESSKSTLLNHLNQNIGGGTVEWVAKKAIPQENGTFLQTDGWDFDQMQVDLMTLPPLPDKASLPEDIDETPWNLIRIGRTVDGEAVWDLSGQGWGLLPKKDADGNTMRGADGMPLFPSSLKEKGAEMDTNHHGNGAGITCPMSLVPLDVDTLVWVLDDSDDTPNGDNINMDNNDAERLEPRVLPAHADQSADAVPETIVLL